MCWEVGTAELGGRSGPWGPRAEKVEGNKIKKKGFFRQGNVYQKSGTHQGKRQGVREAAEIHWKGNGVRDGGRTENRKPKNMGNFRRNLRAKPKETQDSGKWY